MTPVSIELLDSVNDFIALLETFSTGQIIILILFLLLMEALLAPILFGLFQLAGAILNLIYQGFQLLYHYIIPETDQSQKKAAAEQQKIIQQKRQYGNTSEIPPYPCCPKCKQSFNLVMCQALDKNGKVFCTNCKFEIQLRSQGSNGNST